MRILFVADGRSPITLSWLRYWLERGDAVHLVSTFPCPPPAGLASFAVMPVGFSRLGGSQMITQSASPAAARRARRLGRFRSLFLFLRYYLGPLSLPLYRRRFRLLVSSLQPDLIHALRIPFEGMLASLAPAGTPLVISTWGNDLTLHARGSPLMNSWTRRTLRRACGLMADAARDIRLGRQLGFAAQLPDLVVPGAGGVMLEEIARSAGLDGSLPAPVAGGQIIVNPRGSRPGSLRNDVFFQAAALVIKKAPGARFFCPPLANDPEALRWVDELNLAGCVHLWPRLEQPQLWALFHRAQVYVSPSVHDGTPNSLLEAMACGCFPIAGDIESMREWIVPGENGLLVDAANPQAMAEAILQALADPKMRARAARSNARLISKRAEYQRCMAQVGAFYDRVLKDSLLRAR